jgi:hypothetical protein
MTAQQKPSRSVSIRQRRSSQKRSNQTANRTGTATGRGSRNQTSRQAYHPSSVFLPVEPRPVAPTTLRKMRDGSVSVPFSGRESTPSRRPASTRGTRAGGMGRMAGKRGRKGYDFAFSLGRTSVRAPAINLPALGSRWVSAGLTLLLGILLYTLWTANTFTVTAAEVSGNQRLDSTEVNAALGMVGQSIFKAVPSQIEKNLRAAFPDLERVSVRVGLPNHISVSLVERGPVLAWFQGDKTTWIDPSGVAFVPRGNVEGLIQVDASGDPPAPQVQDDSQESLLGRPFMSPALVQAILALSPQIPDGAPMIYDPEYGMGWQDPRGWSVYFGQDTQDIEMKKNVYQAITDSFTRQGIQPTLISVAYLDAPFYK